MTEMGGYTDLKRTTDHTSLCKGMMDAIFDIADEAYNHQQRLDSKEIDPRNWHEWMQLFKNDKPTAGVHEKLAIAVS